MLRRVALVRTEVSEERIAAIIRVTRTGELGTTLAVTTHRSTLRKIVTVNVRSSAILVTLKMEAIHSSEMSFLTRATWRNNPEDSILLTTDIHQAPNSRMCEQYSSPPYAFMA
jgi:hypothetical protein